MEINIFYLGSPDGKPGYFFAKMNNKTVEKPLSYKQAIREISKMMIAESRKKSRIKKHKA